MPTITSTATDPRASTLAAAVGPAIRQHRRDRGWTLEELARRSGLSRSYLNELELGTKTLNLRRLDSIAAALGVPFEELLGQLAIQIPKTGRTLAAVAARIRAEQPQADAVLRRLTDWRDLDDMLRREAGSPYRPTCRVDLDPQAAVVAETFDRAMVLLGDVRRAHVWPPAEQMR